MWRRTHLLVYLAWPLALLHGLGMGSDTTQRPVLILCCAAALAVFLAVVATLVRAARGGPSVNSAPGQP